MRSSSCGAVSASAERPPSEQGVEYQLLDALGAVRDRLEAIERRPALYGPSPNWWDVLPGPEALGGYDPGLPVQATTVMQLYGNPATHWIIRVQVMADRIDLTLRVNDAWTVWERSVFFPGRSPIAP